MSGAGPGVATVSVSSAGASSTRTAGAGSMGSLFATFRATPISASNLSQTARMSPASASTPLAAPASCLSSRPGAGLFSRRLASSRALWVFTKAQEIGISSAR